MVLTCYQFYNMINVLNLKFKLKMFYPFFLAVCKYYDDEPLKQKMLRNLAFNKGGMIISKNNILITPNGQFKIPSVYSFESHQELDNKLWKKDEYQTMFGNIQEQLTSWSTLNKKNKQYLLYKYCAQHYNFETALKCTNFLNIASLMKMIKNSDVVYELFKILSISPHLVDSKTFEKIVFLYNYNCEKKRDEEQSDED